MVDGIEQPNISFHYFDTENFVPIASESEVPSGPMKGQMSTNTMSDYQEVDGIYFPFSMSFGVKGSPNAQTMTISKIELNPTIEDSAFQFPEEEVTTEEKK